MSTEPYPNGIVDPDDETLDWQRDLHGAMADYADDDEPKTLAAGEEEGD
ncbi:hypothetical protein [Zhihengliuella halotolerans]|nr:hypothetical protein [Zhihengliuella halotolerans]